jgi:hypothetical protein
MTNVRRCNVEVTILSCNMGTSRYETSNLVTTTSHSLQFITHSLFLSYSDFFNLAHCRYGGLLQLLITLKDRHTHKLGRSSLDEGSARRRGPYLTAHNTYKRETSMRPVGIDPTIPATSYRRIMPHTAQSPGSVQCTTIIIIFMPLTASLNKQCIKPIRSQV